jgi:hypothetical protein
MDGRMRGPHLAKPNRLYRLCQVMTSTKGHDDEG